MNNNSYTHMLHSWKVKFNHILNEDAQNKWLTVAVGVGLLLAGSWYGYRYWVTSREEAAYTILNDCLAEYEAAMHDKAKLPAVVTMCQIGYEKFKNTYVAPFIIAVQVDALLAEQKKPEALELLSRMIHEIGNSSSINDLFKLKYALVQLDMPDTALKETGLKQLQDLAANEKNIYNDAAQFYLGLYYESNGSFARAKEVWSKLAILNEVVHDEQGQSPWAVLAQQKASGLQA